MEKTFQTGSFSFRLRFPEELVLPVDTEQSLSIDRPCVGGAGVLAHKDGSDPDALLPQSTNLLCGVLQACLAIVAAAERHLAGGEKFAAVIRAGIGQQDHQMTRGGAGGIPDQIARSSQRQTVPVPA